MEQSGVVIDRKATDMLPEGVQIRPLRDHIVIKPLEWEPSKILQIAGNTRKPLRGVVTAVGPGAYRKRYTFNSRGERVRVQEKNGRPIPCDVKVGDTVELGGLEIDGYKFPQFLIGNELHLMCQEADVCGVLTTV